MIRRAGVQDIAAVGRIVNGCAEYGLMLHRSPAYLYEHVRDFYVAVEGDGLGGEKVVGVCGLKVVWADLAEVYSLAVDPAHRGKGLGRELVWACVEEAERLGIRKLMVLTYEKAFFERQGFGVVDRQELPMKVWSECVRCSKNQACDEIAMMKVLEGVPVREAPAEPVGAEDYEVPVQLVVTVEGKRGKMDEGEEVVGGQ